MPSRSRDGGATESGVSLEGADWALAQNGRHLGGSVRPALGLIVEILEGFAVEAVRHVVERRSAGAGGPSCPSIRSHLLGYGVRDDHNLLMGCEDQG